jgi:transcriptional regulator with XRE-family HTH domain
MGLVNVSSIGSFIREQREQAVLSIRQLAQAAGVSDPYLSQIERGLRKPSAEVLHQMARVLRISAEVINVQAGILDQPDGAAVRKAVLTDSLLTERQKQMLIEVYESFRREALLAVGDDEPADAHDEPADAGEEWSDSGDTPAGHGDTPAGHGDTPAGHGDTPAGHGDTPAGRGDTPADNGEAPADAGGKRRVGNRGPSAGGGKPATTSAGTVIISQDDHAIAKRPARESGSADPDGSARMVPSPVGNR